MESVLGEVVARVLHGGDWRDHRAQEVSKTIRDPSNHVWVAGPRSRMRSADSWRLEPKIRSRPLASFTCWQSTLPGSATELVSL
jgi:hypothetical protein